MRFLRPIATAIVVITALTCGAVDKRRGEAKAMSQQELDWITHLDAMDDQTRMRHLSQVDEERLAVLGALLRQLDSSASKNVQAAAIYLIGRYHFSQGVPELIRRIDVDTGDQPKKAAEPLWERYPAMEALITIGLPSVQPAIELLATDTDELRRTLAAKVVRYVEGPDVARFVLDRACTKETDPKRKANLKNAAARIEKLIQETT
jgi:hypothetical protein